MATNWFNFIYPWTNQQISHISLNLSPNPTYIRKIYPTIIMPMYKHYISVKMVALRVYINFTQLSFALSLSQPVDQMRSIQKHVFIMLSQRKAYARCFGEKTAEHRSENKMATPETSVRPVWPRFSNSNHRITVYIRLQARVLSGRSIVAHLWPYIYGDWSWRISAALVVCVAETPR